MNVIDQIVAEAKREDEELKRKKRFKNLEIKEDPEQEEIIENMLVSPGAGNIIVDIRDIPVSFETFISFDPNVFMTNGCYSIRYVPKTDYRSVPGKPFVIGQDMVRLRVTVSGPDHWHKLSERIPELGWIERNTYITRRLFGIAKKHPGISFFFTVKWEEYADRISWNARQNRLDIDNKPFVSYKCSQKNFANIYSKKQLAPKRTELDYAKEIWEVDQEFLNSQSVLEENKSKSKYKKSK